MTVRTRWIIALILCGLASLLRGQIVPRVTLSGIVLDDSTSVPVQNVNVFLAHTALGCSTDAQGRFVIMNIPTGSFECVASRVGYVFTMERLSLSESVHRKLTIRLKPASVQVPEVVVNSPDISQWREQLKAFTALFLGTSTTADSCKILNPEVLDFETGENHLFTATARAPIVIENRALGYRIRFILMRFRHGRPADMAGLVRQYGQKGDLLVTDGYPMFESLAPASPDDTARWRVNRARAYRGSFRHFLTSLFRNELEQQGFEAYLEPFLVTADWSIQRRPVQERELSTPTSRKYEKTLKFSRYLEVEYTKGTLESKYDFVSRKGTDSQVSWMQLNTDAVTFDSRGLIRGWFATISDGYWAWQRVAEELPSDYDPEEE